MFGVWNRLAAFVLMLLPLPALADASKTADPGYLVVVGQSSDRAAMGRYTAALPPIYAKHAGYYLGIGGPGRGVSWRQGPWGDRSLVLGRFPTRETVDAFWWDEDYRKAVRLRDRAGVFSVLAVSAAGPTPFQGVGSGYLVVMLSALDASQGDQASVTFARSVEDSGGVVMTPLGQGAARPLEGDTVFNRVWIAGWPSHAARDAFLNSRAGRTAQSAWTKAGFAVSATIDGVPRSQPPPAAAAAAPPAR